jgi:hypothetical protein
MAIIKLATSKKSVMFIDDDGNVFITSVVGMSQLLNDKRAILECLRMPNKTNDTRFRKSPVYEPATGTRVVGDMLDKKNVDAAKDSKMYNVDVKI